VAASFIKTTTKETAMKWKPELTRNNNGVVEKFCYKCSCWKDKVKCFGVKKINNRIGVKKERTSCWCKTCCVKSSADLRKKRGRAATPLSLRMQRLCAGVWHSQRDTKIRTPYLRKLYKKQNGKCYYTGVEMKLVSDKKNDPLIMSIDKKDPSLGYAEGNVVLCCLGINYLKGVHSAEYMYECLRLFAAGAASK
jgi:hypothetical protein